MKKLLTACAVLALTPAAWADGVALVQKMYQEARHNDGTSVVKKHADGALKKLIVRSEKSGELCVDADPMWNNQDPETAAKVSVSALGGNKVRASFVQYGERQNIVYTVNCSAAACKVSNVGRLKQTLAACR
ncbi:hypothetical protein L4G92_06845 [Neisseria sp. ZJ106]|uniref:Uncharacterized protein n=1 Tax=Neisseria lisongii TaxID=2912188 RepID=A0ABY7RJP0_9NEIS|nr:hypothetical protein [Neisseria lisongii]MCF7521762.1 hypothetical protein [Neisseria lisongii]WCL71001.1 hypothetical protein PJU73_06460 [Neisseria lisongii]